MQSRLVFAVLIMGCVAPTESKLSTRQSELSPNSEQVRNSAGLAEAYSPLGTLAELRANNAFFKNLGTTGRTCNSCHGVAGAWTTSAADLLWKQSNGTDPLFMFTHDNGVCPDSDISKKHLRKEAMVLTLTRGSTRGVGRVAPTAQFEVTAIEDPYNCSATTFSAFFGYRKPNPTTSVSQKSSVTWAPAAQPDMRATLKALFVGATQVHGLTTYVPTNEEQNQAADFMLDNYFAQIVDKRAGRLDADGALGGPVHLANQVWFPGINHPSTGPTTRHVFSIFDAWLTIDPSEAADCDEHHGKHGYHDYGDEDDDDGTDCAMLERRALIAEGQEIFNERQNANGGTCSGCHNSPNVGTHSVYRLFDIGAVDIADPELPRIHLRNKTTGEERVVANLGRASATGLWSDVGRMAVPLLRGLSSRAPYFDSGQAKTLGDVVDHYDRRFNFGFTWHERAALVAFLSAL